jgi:hypothetical protein
LVRFHLRARELDAADDVERQDDADGAWVI